MGKRAIIFSQSKKTILQPLRHALFLPPSAQIQSIRAVQEYAQRHFTLTERYQMTLIQTAEGSKYWTLNIWSKSWDILMGSSWAVDGMWTWDMMWTWLMIYFWIYHDLSFWKNKNMWFFRFLQPEALTCDYPWLGDRLGQAKLLQPGDLRSTVLAESRLNWGVPKFEPDPEWWLVLSQDNSVLCRFFCRMW